MIDKSDLGEVLGGVHQVSGKAALPYQIVPGVFGRPSCWVTPGRVQWSVRTVVPLWLQHSQLQQAKITLGNCVRGSAQGGFLQHA